MAGGIAPGLGIWGRCPQTLAPSLLGPWRFRVDPSPSSQLAKFVGGESLLARFFRHHPANNLNYAHGADLEDGPKAVWNGNVKLNNSQLLVVAEKIFAGRGEDVHVDV